MLKTCSLDAAQRNQGFLPTAEILDFAAQHQGYPNMPENSEFLQ